MHKGLHYLHFWRHKNMNMLFDQLTHHWGVCKNHMEFVSFRLEVWSVGSKSADSFSLYMPMPAPIWLSLSHLGKLACFNLDPSPTFIHIDWNQFWWHLLIHSHAHTLGWDLEWRVVQEKSVTLSYTFPHPHTHWVISSDKAWSGNCGLHNYAHVGQVSSL